MYIILDTGRTRIDCSEDTSPRSREEISACTREIMDRIGLAQDYMKEMKNKIKML